MPSDPAAPDVQDAKRRLRAVARAARAAAAAAGAPAGDTLRDISLEELIPKLSTHEPDGVISAYWPMGDELDPRPLMLALAQRGHRLALPAIRAAGQPLDFRAWQPGDPLQPAGFGTHEPLPQAPLVQPVMLLIPLLAFDAAGYRLGYGGGFYDRSLALLRRTGDILAVGLAYAAQQVAAVPREATDQALDLVVTEAGVVRPRPEPGPD